MNIANYIHTLLNTVPKKEKQIIEILGEHTYNSKLLKDIVVYDRSKMHTVFADCKKFDQILYRNKKIDDTIQQLDDLIKEEKDQSVLDQLIENRRKLDEIRYTHANICSFHSFEYGKLDNSIKIICIAPVAYIQLFDHELCIGQNVDTSSLQSLLKNEFINSLHQKILKNKGIIYCLSWEKYEFINANKQKEVIIFLEIIKKYLDLLAKQYDNIHHIHFQLYSRDRYSLQVNQIQTLLSSIQ